MRPSSGATRVVHFAFIHQPYDDTRLLAGALTLETPPQENPPGFVYVLGTLTARGTRTYVGWTLDPERRLAQHNAGTGAKSTRGGCWSLLYVERLESRSAAMSREWYLKRDRRFRGELARALRD